MRSPLTSLPSGLWTLTLPLSFEIFKGAFKQLPWLIPRLQVARQVCLVQLPREFVFFGVGPDHSDSVLKGVDNSQAAVRAASNGFLEDEQQMSQTISRAGVVAKCRVKNDLPGLLIGQ